MVVAFVRSYLCLALFLSGAHALAQAAFSVDETNTGNSTITLSGKNLDPSQKFWIHVYPSKNNSEETAQDLFPAAGATTLQQKIYLNQGNGSYIVLICFQAANAPAGSSWSQSTYFTILNSDPIDQTSLLPSANVQSDNAEIVDMAKSITAGMKDDLTKSRAIHDWVASHISYDLDAYDSTQPHVDDALTTFRRRKSMCGGYSDLNAALHRAVGLRARVIDGQAWLGNLQGAHAWNEILIDGRWVTEDTTWDAGYVTNAKVFKFKLTERYFDPSAKTFAENHLREEVSSD
jgi:transglutaminase-like putative cysteine protease